MAKPPYFKLFPGGHEMFLGFINTFVHTVMYYYYLLSHPRVNDYFLVESPVLIIFIVSSYLYFTKKLGPRMMKNRKPFGLKKVMMAYNILQIIVNAFLTIEAYRWAWGWEGKFKMICEPVDRSYSPIAIYITRLVHLFYMMKFLDLMDTVFMVLRKKNHHVSFLHVYHHALMFAISWAITKYYPGGHVTFIGFINSFVHAIMYSYYLLTTIWPPYARTRLWWKKYLTIIQMVQFVIVGIHMTLPLFQPNCDQPRLAGAFLVIPQAVLFFFLFSDFYKKSYLNTSSDKKS